MKFVERIEMIMKEREALGRIGRSITRQCCPECGLKMEIIDCHRENVITFIWYRCSRDGCKGQWLKKVSSSSPNCLKKVC